MLGPCPDPGGLPADVKLDEFVGRAQWWAAFSCGYAAYRAGKPNKNPYRKNADLKEGWGKGYSKAKLDCREGGWVDIIPMK